MMLAALLAVVGLPGETPAFDVAAFVDVEADCPVRRYGGRNVALCDLSPAARRALEACYARVSTWAGDRDLPCRLDLPSGTFFAGETIEACHEAHINGPETKLLTAAGRTGVRFLGFGACLASGRPKGAGGSLVGVTLLPFSVTPTTARAYGVEAEAPVVLEDLTISGYTQGIRISAGAKRSPPSNANRWRIVGGRVSGSLHAGISIDGPDTNVGVAIQPSSTGNCLRAADLASLGACAQTVDGSLLGSTWIAASAAYAERVEPIATSFILGDSENSRSVCVGCYSEDPSIGIAESNVNVIAGKSVWSSANAPSIYQGQRMTALSLLGADGLAELRLGTLSGGGALTLLPVGQPSSPAAEKPRELRLKYEVSGGFWRLDVGNSNAAVPLRIGAKQNALGGLGSLILRPSTGLVYLGGSAQVVQGRVQ